MMFWWVFHYKTFQNSVLHVFIRACVYVKLVIDIKLEHYNQSNMVNMKNQVFAINVNCLSNWIIIIKDTTI